MTPRSSRTCRPANAAAVTTTIDTAQPTNVVDAPTDAATGPTVS